MAEYISSKSKGLRKLTVLAICLIVTLTAVMFPMSNHAAAAYLTGKVTVTDTPLNVRSQPDSTSKKLGTLNNGDIVTITATVNGTRITTSKWYQIIFNGGTAYVSCTYVTIVTEYVYNQQFEDHLNNQGFPESYKEGLRNLFAIHPNWTFNANHTGLKWSDALAGECELKRSLVQKSSIGSYLSYQQGAYNFDTDSLVVFDSGGWVQASQPLVAYCLDPRNYLTDNYALAFLNLSYTGTETEENVSAILSGTFMSGNLPDNSMTFAQAIMKAASEAGVSAYNLASRIRQEQGSNGNSLATGTVSGYEGYYNYFNIQAAAGNGLSAIQNGAAYAKSQGWNSPYAAILGGAKFIAKGYISVGQNSLYLQRFDLVENGGYYTHQYMTNIRAVFGEASSLKNAYTDSALLSNLTLTIPVFDDMPDSACTAPTGTGSNNYLMQNLWVDGFSITPSFYAYTNSYELVVESSVSSINVCANGYAGSTVTGAGNISLDYGYNHVNVTVTSEAGTPNLYTLTVYRKSNEAPQINCTKYSFIDTFVSEVEAETSVSDFIRNLEVSSSGTVTVSDRLGNVKNESEFVGTDDAVKIYWNGNVYKQFTVAVDGDINGDGKLTAVDLLMGKAHITGKSILTGAPLIAADIDRNGYVSTRDMLLAQKIILKSIL